LICATLLRAGSAGAARSREKKRDQRKKIEIGGKTPYQKWIESQGIPLIRDYYIEDLRKVALAPWDWKGFRGVSQSDWDRRRQRRYRFAVSASALSSISEPD
jgi:hypothetical protein